jgi:succinoglycan biosynthesis protein ExoA
MPDVSAGVVAIVIPVLNEAAHLRDVVHTLAGQARHLVAEILIVDGGSTDATIEIARSLASDDPRIRLLDNPKRLQSAAVNLAAALAAPGVTMLIRADAHAGYPKDFIETLVREARETGAQSVTNQLHSTGESCFQRAVAAVSNSKFGTGGAVHRSGGKAGYVDHAHHALFDRAWYERLGGYDESFVANEDAEYDVRLRAAGGKIWFTPDASVAYHPRKTPSSLARQYYRYGIGRARNRQKHGERLRVRQMIPPAMVLAVLGGILLSLLSPWFLIIPGGYLAGVAAATALLLARSKDICVSGALVALPIMHMAWGLGFLRATLTPKR